MTEPNLYAILLGGKADRNLLMEDHQLVFVVAENEVDAAIAAKKKWNVQKSHIDGIKKLDTVDGFEIHLKRKDEEN